MVSKMGQPGLRAIILIQYCFINFDFITSEADFYFYILTVESRSYLRSPCIVKTAVICKGCFQELTDRESLHEDSVGCFS